MSIKKTVTLTSEMLDVRISTTNDGDYEIEFGGVNARGFVTVDEKFLSDLVDVIKDICGRTTLPRLMR